MEAELREHVAFYLTGRREATRLGAIDALDLRPALLARYHDLATLRYDFPVVLVSDAKAGESVEPLSGVIDRLLTDIAQREDADRTTKQVLRLEAEIRALAAAGTKGTLKRLWEVAAARLGANEDVSLRASLDHARAALRVDGEIADCDAELAARVVTHLFRARQAEKARLFRTTVERLTQKLSDMLRADFVRSEAGRSAESLEAAMGSLHGDAFDFGALSSLLKTASPGGGMPEARRRRIEWLLATLKAHPFDAVTDKAGTEDVAHRYTFPTCTSALAAYRERLPGITEVAKALAIAELEVTGAYKETRHDLFFEAFGDGGLDPADLALFPDYLVVINARAIDAGENATLTQVLSAGLPIKVLVRSDDVLDEVAPGESHIGFGRLSRPVASMAMGLNEVFVAQASASHLYRYRSKIERGLKFHGAALFRVFSGATGQSGSLPPYLVAAAAMESRAFPAWTYDPSAGADWASRFDVSDNPQPERDWPVASFAYEDAGHQTMREDMAFTLVDFAACDGRYARHFALVPREQWTPRMVAATRFAGSDTRKDADDVPCLAMVDRENRLQRVLVDDKLIREARRCLAMWHSLQELGGIHSSHAERILARERKARAEEVATSPAVGSTPAVPTVAAPAAAKSAPAEPATAAPEPASDDPYIETPRCTSCNECTNVNNKLFAYNENKQAYVADPGAGTFKDLVEAAESCQVAIIHPGKPRNPDEPGLEDLLRRAEAFR
jgi:ferredoxin